MDRPETAQAIRCAVRRAAAGGLSSGTGSVERGHAAAGGSDGFSDGWRLRLQADCDTEIARAALGKALAKIKPWTESAREALRSSG